MSRPVQGLSLILLLPLNNTPALQWMVRNARTRGGYGGSKADFSLISNPILHHPAVSSILGVSVNAQENTTFIGRINTLGSLPLSFVLIITGGVNFYIFLFGAHIMVMALDTRKDKIGSQLKYSPYKTQISAQ